MVFGYTPQKAGRFSDWYETVLPVGASLCRHLLVASNLRARENSENLRQYFYVIPQTALSSTNGSGLVRCYEVRKDEKISMRYP
jgi:hypothetical protein